MLVGKALSLHISSVLGINLDEAFRTPERETCLPFGSSHQRLEFLHLPDDTHSAPAAVLGPITGTSCFSANSRAFSTDAAPSSSDGKRGAPAILAIALAFTVSPSWLIASAEGPIQTSLADSTAAAKEAHGYLGAFPVFVSRNLLLAAREFTQQTDGESVISQRQPTT